MRLDCASSEQNNVYIEDTQKQLLLLNVGGRPFSLYNVVHLLINRMT